MEFNEPHRIDQLLKEYQGNWMIAGGWAIDLYLNKISRSHQDIEIAIPRTEQLQLQSYLANWELRYVQKGVFFEWENAVFLELPIHEIHGNSEVGKLEILLNEIEDEKWVFRRNPAIHYPENQLKLISQQGIPILCPEVVLLYKAKINKEKDRWDLQQILPKLSPEKRDWLAWAIQQTHGAHEWVRVVD